MTDIQRGAKLCSDKGGVLDIVALDDGEVLVSIDVPGGVIDANQYLDLAAGIGRLEVASGLAVIQPRGAGPLIRHPDMHKSGANPDYVPPSGSERLVMQLRGMIDEVRERSDHVERREAALRSIERMPRAAEASPDSSGEVIEPTEGAAQ